MNFRYLPVNEENIRYFYPLLDERGRTLLSSGDELLKAGAVDALAIDVTSGNFLMSGETDYEFLSEVLGSEQYGIGFRKDDQELCDKVNAALDALAADGTVAKIAANYPEIADYITLGK